MNYRAYKIFNSTELNIITDKVASVVSDWKKQWLKQPKVIGFDIFTSEDVSQHINDCSSEWMPGKYGNQTYGICWSDDLLTELYKHIGSQGREAWANTKPSSHISLNLINICVCSLIDELCKAFYTTNDSISSSFLPKETFAEDLCRSGSGYTLICLNLADNHHLLLAFDLSSIDFGTNIEQRPGDRKLEPAISAFGNRTVNIEIILGHSVIDFETLANFSIGDVLTVDSAADSNIDLIINDQKFGSCKLGRIDDKFAVKIQDGA